MRTERNSLVLVATCVVCGGGCGLLLGLDEFVDAPPPEEDGGAGGAGVCTPSAIEACYSGPPGTEGVGVCKAGQRQCNEDGSGFGACQGEVTPGIEACATLGDEDCDGVACSEVVWARIFGDDVTQRGSTVAVDPSGAIVLGGSLEGTVDFGGGVLTSTGSTDVFVAKFDAAGKHIWSKRFGDLQDQATVAIAVDALGNILLTGSFTGSIDFGGGALTTPGGYSRVFVTKISAAGDHVWSKAFGSGLVTQTPSALAVTSAGDVVVVGQFGDVINFGTGDLVSVGNYDVFVAKLDGGDGAGVWGRRFGDTESQVVSAVAVDDAANVVVAGQFQGSVNFGGGDLMASAPNHNDIFVVKFDASGSHGWSKGFGYAPEDQFADDVDVDGEGNVVLTGRFRGSVSFGGANLVSLSHDIFMAKFSDFGSHVWSRRFGAVLGVWRPRVTVDASGDIVTTCGFGDGIDFGGGPLVGAGNYDIAVAKVSPSGAHVWSRGLGGQGVEKPWDTAVDRSSGHVVVTGEQLGTVDYGWGPLTSAGGFDVFLVKLAP